MPKRQPPSTDPNQPGYYPATITAVGLIRPGEAAKRLGIPRQRITHELDAGHLAHTQRTPNGIRLIHPDDAKSLKAAGPVRMIPTPAGTIAYWPTTPLASPIHHDALSPADWRQLRQALAPILQPLLDQREHRRA